MCKKNEIPHANHQMCQLIVMCYVLTLLSLFSLSFALWPKNSPFVVSKKGFHGTSVVDDSNTYFTPYGYYLIWSIGFQLV